MGWLRKSAWAFNDTAATPRAQGLWITHTKPVKLLAGIKLQPTQLLALRTDREGTLFKGRQRFHILSYFGEKGDTQALAQILLHR